MKNYLIVGMILAILSVAVIALGKAEPVSRDRFPGRLSGGGTHCVD